MSFGLNRVLVLQSFQTVDEDETCESWLGYYLSYIIK